MESKFKVGDRVKVVSRNDEHVMVYYGMEGTILQVSESKSNFGVLFDKKINGHNLSSGQDYNNNAWWLSVNELQLTKPHDIHTDIQSLKDKYPQFNITVSVEEKL